MFYLSVYTPKTFAAPLNPACPLNVDTITYVDPTNNNCYSANDPTNNAGYNIVQQSGGKFSCGPVDCPGKNTGYRQGHTCIRSIAGKCYPGFGSSGFNSTNCTIDTFTTPVTVFCPNAMDLSMQVIDENGNPVNGITFTVNYGDDPLGHNNSGFTATATSDATGNAKITGKLFSGDHYIIIPSDPQGKYTFEPNQYGNTTNLGVFEMNTLWSCGTPLGNGTTNDPCIFIAHPIGTIITQPKSCNDCLTRSPQQTYFCTNSVSGQTLCSGAAFKPFACQRCTPLPSPLGISNITCQSLEGTCKQKNTCINGNELDSGNLDCGPGYTCCSQLPYKPNLTSTLLVFGALALVGLFL